ncbi:hypothetical protein M758_12G008400 [Ceratodon purpureus]|nr:hypothetical protein M758_12G008100 [Ceratodon purpureus]KAG0597603.1 hypothetical protein M758_12G008400 [Ceratodon purpureus]
MYLRGTGHRLWSAVPGLGFGRRLGLSICSVILRHFLRCVLRQYCIVCVRECVHQQRPRFPHSRSSSLRPPPPRPPPPKVRSCCSSCALSLLAWSRFSALCGLRSVRLGLVSFLPPIFILLPGRLSCSLPSSELALDVGGL